MVPRPRATRIGVGVAIVVALACGGLWLALSSEGGEPKVQRAAPPPRPSSVFDGGAPVVARD
ncbi:MAG: hypothetical protein KC416_09030, partial [Myxococcales bacterium]|nr:hypothetical protein [Myxococcales bacterium]